MTDDAVNLQKMHARVQKLIAQAESTSHREEAHAFMAAAEDLMTRYAIDRSHLEEETGQREALVTLNFQYPHSPAYWATDKTSAALVVRAIGLVGIAVTNPTKTVWLYGTQQDAEYTKTVILSVWKQARKHMRVWKKGLPHLKNVTGPQLRDVEKGFLMGFGRGASDKIQDARTTVETEMGSALVLVTRRDEIKQLMGSEGVYQNRRGGARSVSGLGYSAGRERGRGASLGEEVAGARKMLA